MNGDDASEDTLPPAVSWRDVYRAVGQSEARVLAQLKQIDDGLRAVIERHDARLRELKSQDDKLVGQLSAWRSIVVFLGLPGLLSLLTIVAAAIAGVTVTGSGGLTH